MNYYCKIKINYKPKSKLFCKNSINYMPRSKFSSINYKPRSKFLNSSSEAGAHGEYGKRDLNWHFSYN